MTTFKRTNVKIFTKSGPKSTPDTIYWKKLGIPVLLKEFGPIDYVDFSPVEPHYFAVTCSVRVQVYNPITKNVTKNLSRFRETAYGGTFRSDGRLLCAGGEESVIKLFDVGTKSLLRVFKGHTSAVHRCFFTQDTTHIASFSDDKSVALWDIPSEKQVTSFAEHTDYVRAGAVSPVSTDIILSGGYDNTVQMYDARIKERVFKVDHGAPVESVLFLPSGGIFISAGGTEVRVWDAFAGGRLLAKLSQHHKTVTCLRLGSGNKRLLSGSLDRHVKIYDISTYQVAHTLDFPNAVLSLGISARDETVVAGMVDGLVSVARRDEETTISKQEQKKVSYRFAADNMRPLSVDVFVPEEKRDKFSDYDICLRKFQYSKAVTCVMKPIIINLKPEVAVSLFQELIRRKGLTLALASRDHKSLLTILKFVVKYIGDHRFTRTLIDVSNKLLDIYDDITDQTPEVTQMLKVLARHVKANEQLTEQLLSLQGAVQLLLSGASFAESGVESQSANLEPSISAQENFVVNLT